MLACLFYLLSKPVSPNKKACFRLNRIAKLQKKQKPYLNVAEFINCFFVVLFTWF